MAIRTAAENNADIVSWQWIAFYTEDEISIDIVTNPATHALFESQYIIDNYYPNNRYTINPAVWNKLYKKIVFEDLRFPKGIIYEDSYVFFQILEASKRIIVLDENLYYYFQRSNSIMNAKFSEKNFHSCLFTAKYIDFFIRQKNNLQRNYAANDYLNRYTQNMLMVYLNYNQYKKDFSYYHRKYFENLRFILINPTICRMKKLMAIMLIVNPQTAYKICKKYFPECLYESMR